MGVVTKTKFSEISKSHYLFSTFNFFRLRKLIDEDLLYLQVRLSEYFEIISGFAFSSKDYTDEGVSVCRIGDISKYNELLIDEMLLLPEEYADDYSKYCIQNNDILIGLTGDGKFFKTCYVENLEVPILLNQRVGIIRVKPNVKKVSAKFVSLLFNSDKVQNQIRIVAMGKTQKNVSPFDILNVKIPKLELDEQNELLQLIKPIENEITQLKNSKLKPLDIINKVFGDEFGFDWELCDKYINNKFHKAKFTEIANDEFKFDISLKYRKAFEIAKNNSNINWINLNELVTVKGGKRLQKGEVVMEEETDYKYIRVDDLSREGNFDLDNIKFITEKNHLSIKNYIAEKDDILLTIVGATIGKCGIVPAELDKENITENFARLIIKDKVKFNPTFILYSLMSRICQFQFSEYSGKSSQGKLALFRIKKTIIPYVEYIKQTEIVEKIKSQIDAQNSIDRQIEEKQQQINEIIENAIKTE